MKDRLPLWSAWAGLLLAVGAMLLSILAACGGHLSYTLDDTYIHLSIARHLLEQGTWGVSYQEFVPAGSSPIYIFLLTITNATFYSPLIWNILSGIIIIYLTDKALVRENAGTTFRLLAAAWMIFAAPLHLMIPLGMEATLFAAATLAFALHSAYALAANQPGRAEWGSALLLSLLMCGLRFEGALVAGAVALGWLLRRRWGLALGILAAGALPALLHGAISMANGHHFLPNSVSLKAGFTQLLLGATGEFIKTETKRFFENPFMLHLLLALAAAAAWSYHHTRRWTPVVILNAVLLLATLLHMLVADVSFYRYEAHLIVAGFAAISLALAEQKPALPQGVVRLFVVVFVGIWVLPFMIRSVYYTLNHSLGAKNIYEQQYQMARFLQKYYPTGSVAANDIGAITYLNPQIRLLDMVGIGSTPIADSYVYREGEFQVPTETVQLLAQERGVQLAIVYEEWMGKSIPKSWTKIATWTIPDNFICAEEQVMFYAAQSQEISPLLANLKAFESQLPAGVQVAYLPLASPADSLNIRQPK